MATKTKKTRQSKKVRKGSARQRRSKGRATAKSKRKQRKTARPVRSQPTPAAANAEESQGQQDLQESLER